MEATLRTILNLNPSNLWTHFYIADALLYMGEFESAVQELLDLGDENDPLMVAQVYAYSGDVDAAFEWLDRGEGPDIDSYFNPLLRNLHDDPRWAAWIAQMDPSMEERAAIRFEVRLPR